MYDFDKSGPQSPEIREQQGIGIVLFDAEGHLSHANPAFAAMLGHDGVGCFGLALNDLFDNDSAAWIAGLAAQTNDFFQAKCRCRRKDGSALKALLSISILRGPDVGHAMHMTVKACTIEEGTEANTVLVDTEQRWRSALEAANQGVWDHNNFSGEKYHSPAWRRMRGMTDSDPVPVTLETWLQRIHPDDHATVVEYVRRQDAGELDHIAYEFREQHRDGHWVWILSRGKPVEWQPDGTPIRIIGTDTDITELKTAEAQLAAEKERLKVTLQSIGDGVISTDTEARITFMNPIAEQMTGWSFAEANGMPLDQIFAVIEHVSGNAPANPVVECLTQQDAYKIDTDVVLLSRSGERHDIRNSAAPVRTAGGEIIGAVLVFQDVTDSRALQEQLAHAASHDSLTGLPNRAAFESALAIACTQLGQHALCFMDIDRFKAVNDSAGHAAGDALLRQIAQTIRRCCRNKDFAARIGGDEFMLLLADCSPKHAVKMAQKLVEAINATPFLWNGVVYRVGASIGITDISGQSKSTAMLMSEADAACYAAKAGGRGGVATHQPRRDIQKSA